MGRDEPADNNSSDSDKKPEEFEGHFPQPDFLKDLKEFLKTKQATQNRLALAIMVSSLLITGVLLFILWPRPEVIVVEKETEKVLKEGKKEPIMREVTNKAPTAVIKADKSLGGVPFTVNFDGRDSSDTDGSIENCHWDFGDGVTDNDPFNCEEDYTFKEPGKYTVVLTVTDDQGDKAQASTVIEAVDSTPRISNLEVLTDWIRAERKNREINIRFDYLDRARDLSEENCEVEVKTHSGYLKGIKDVDVRQNGDRGTLEATFIVSNVKASTLYFDVQLMDDEEHRSNKLNGSVKVRSADHTPRIWNVSMEPTTAVWCMDTEIWISAHYEDEDEDVGPDWYGEFLLTFTTPYDSTYDAEVDVEVKQGDVLRGGFEFRNCMHDGWGHWTVKIQLVDSKNNKSNPVTKSLYVKKFDS